MPEDITLNLSDKTLYNTKFWNSMTKKEQQEYLNKELLGTVIYSNKPKYKK